MEFLGYLVLSTYLVIAGAIGNCPRHECVFAKICSMRVIENIGIQNSSGKNNYAVYGFSESEKIIINFGVAEEGDILEPGLSYTCAGVRWGNETSHGIGFFNWQRPKEFSHFVDG